MKNVREFTDLKGKKVLLRADFDVPVSEKGEIQEPFRIKKQKEMLGWLTARGARVVMAAHIASVKSFAGLVPQLHMLLGAEFNFLKSIEEIPAWQNGSGSVALLENVRQNEGEEKNDPGFAARLAGGFDLYVDNAFAVAHRNHASVSAIAAFLPSFAGLLLESEIKELSGVVDAPATGKVIVMGGAKASTKVPVIKHLIDVSEKILVGGVIANDILKEKGQDMGSSVVDADAHELLAGLDLNDSRLVIPSDFIVFDNKILDIGDATMRAYMANIESAKLIVWNGPMGLFENKAFARGTEVIAEAIAKSSARKIVGGGDTVSALGQFSLLDAFLNNAAAFVSTGGGAMLAFLAGEQLPALKALGYYD
ncbi:MAG TPA: phosphoglycerate kinase [Candidatus Paceibacterota bacterium]|nr:phosphoglycerate kinase [Candidatus Paceibacterota bacterium]